jgi:hypothetical protein
MGESFLRWASRGVAAGAVGTASLAVAYRLERRIRHRDTPVDYDDSLVPGQIVASVLHLASVTERGEAELGSLLRWGYGSAFGVAHGILRRRLPEPAASLVFGSILMSATFTLFPLLGRTPPPWRWPPDVIATSLATHACYVAGVALTDAALGPRATATANGDMDG